jgi:membrane-associated phospholipid phosphatase
LKALIKHNIVYILLYIILLSFVGYILLNIDKVPLQREMNTYVGNSFLDLFLAYVTHLGDGLFAVLIALVFLFKNVRVSLYILFSYAGAGVVSYVLKHLIYYEVYRPHFVFQYYVREPLKLVEGVDVVAFHSFPSGHALSAFALFFCLLFVSRNHFSKIIFFSLAVLAAYSRVHLSQHWLIDIYVGSIIGVCFSILFYVLFYSTSLWPKLNTNLPHYLKSKKKNV